jgi:hypothetical protein
MIWVGLLQGGKGGTEHGGHAPNCSMKYLSHPMMLCAVHTTGQVSFI